MTSTDDIPYLDGLEFAARMRSRLANKLARDFPLKTHNISLSKPLLTICFDDAPMNALSVAAPLLEAFGAHATYYIASSLIGTETQYGAMLDARGLEELHRRGHELGMHTHDHLLLPLVSRAQVRRQFEQNLAVLNKIIPDLPVENFAFPYGQAAFQHRGLVAELSRSARVVHNDFMRGHMDVQHLSCVELGEQRMAWPELDKALERAAKASGWIILMTHDVGAEPSPYGATPQRLRQVLETASRLGFGFANVRQALDMCGVPPFQRANPATRTEF